MTIKKGAKGSTKIVFVSVDLKYKERCLQVNRFQWLSSYMHNFVIHC